MSLILMIIACPACATRYAVPDSAIGVEGRTVRCAKCRHSWFQDGPELDLATLRPDLVDPAVAGVTGSVEDTGAFGRAAGWRDAEAVSGAAHPAYASDYAQASYPGSGLAETGGPETGAPEKGGPENGRPENGRGGSGSAASFMSGDEGDEDFAQTPSSFDHQPPFRPRRNPARMWTRLAVGFALVTTGAMVAVAKFGLPDWLPLPQAASSEPDLKLSFPAGRQERRPLANGNDFFNISGTITNIGQTRRSVPGLLIVLRDSRNRAVYTAEAAPPKPVLAPGESEAINTALVDAPKAAVAAEVQWKRR